MDAIHVLERVLRSLIEAVLRENYGETWLDELGVTPERIDRWRDHLAEERKRRLGVVADESLLSYSDFTDLFTIIKKHWGLFKPCFDDLKRLEVYFGRLAGLRNPSAHSRPLYDYELRLADGMAGELRQQIAIYRSKFMTSQTHRYFPFIETLRDCYGNTRSTLQSATSGAHTGLTLHPGDILRYEGSARDPEGQSVEWTVQAGSHRETIRSKGNAIGFEWTVHETDIGENRSVNFLIRSDRAYHRQTNGYDGEAIFIYTVLPH